MSLCSTNSTLDAAHDLSNVVTKSTGQSVKWLLLKNGQVLGRDATASRDIKLKREIYYKSFVYVVK